MEMRSEFLTPTRTNIETAVSMGLKGKAIEWPINYMFIDIVSVVAVFPLDKVNADGRTGRCTDRTAYKTAIRNLIFRNIHGASLFYCWIEFSSVCVCRARVVYNNEKNDGLGRRWNVSVIRVHTGDSCLDPIRMGFLLCRPKMDFFGKTRVMCADIVLNKIEFDTLFVMFQKRWPPRFKFTILWLGFFYDTSLFSNLT